LSLKIDGYRLAEQDAAIKIEKDIFSDCRTEIAFSEDEKKI
jgi:hypothetical protein